MSEKMDIYLSEKDRKTLEAFKAFKGYENDMIAVNVLLGFGLDMAEKIMEKKGK